MCLLARIIILKMSFSWLFYLLILIFLGGVIVIVTYIVSLAANEKKFLNFKSKSFLITAPLLFLLLDSDNRPKIISSAIIVKPLYEQEFIFSLLFCFAALLLALIRGVKIIKLEEGPIVKRLLKSNLKKNIYLSNIKCPKRF